MNPNDAAQNSVAQNNVAKDNVERLITLTERLVQHLAADAQSFEARRPQDVAGRIEETSRLANLYRHESARIQRDPSIVAGAPKELRSRLVKASETFEAVLARHGRALYAVKTITEGIVRAIAEEVASVRTANAGYGPGGRILAPSGAAITLNRQA